MAARMARNPDEGWVQPRTERATLSLAGETHQPQPAQFLHFRLDRAIGEAQSIREDIGRPVLEAGLVGKPDHGNQRETPPKIRGKPRDHERQQVGTARVADDDDALEMPLPQVVVEHSAEIRSGAVRGPGNLQVGGGDEADNRDRARSEGHGHGLIPLGPATVTGEQDREQGMARRRGELNERKAEEVGRVRA